MLSTQFLRLEFADVKAGSDAMSVAALRLLSPVDRVMSFSAPVDFSARYLRLTFGAPPRVGATTLKVAEITISASTLMGISELVLQLKNLLGPNAAPSTLLDGTSPEDAVYPTLEGLKTVIGYDAMPSIYKDGTGTNLYTETDQLQTLMAQIKNVLGCAFMLDSWKDGTGRNLYEVVGDFGLQLDMTVIPPIRRILGYTSVPASWKDGTAAVGENLYDKLIEVESNLNALGAVSGRSWAGRCRCPTGSGPSAGGPSG
jgi:hypothetical protein